ncbi:hypothetical protein BaRGS_00036463, partial [Batillaria attramentaria]
MWSIACCSPQVVPELCWSRHAYYDDVTGTVKVLTTPPRPPRSPLCRLTDCKKGRGRLVIGEDLQ